MLVLSRQKDETIMIGDDVEITVVDIRGDKVRLGISAPPHIPVHRKEVYEAIRRENRAAAQVRPEDISSITGSSPGGKTEPGKTTPPPAGPTVGQGPERKKGKSMRGNLRAADTENNKGSSPSGNADAGCEGPQQEGE